MSVLNNIVWDINPAIFTIGGFELRYYGIFFASCFILAYIIVKRIYIKENIPVSELDSLAMWVVFGGLIGARIGHCIFYDWNYYKDNIFEIILPFRMTPEFHFTGYQGLASHGGFLGIVIAVYIFKRYSKMNSFFWIMDRIAIPAGLAAALIRFGNLFNSEIYGRYTDLPWGFVFVRNGDSIPSHPTQIYEAILYALASVVLLLLYKNINYRNVKGRLLGVFLFLSASSRFVVEFIKHNQVEFEETMLLNMGQILSLPLILFGVILIIRPKIQKWIAKS